MAWPTEAGSLFSNIQQHITGPVVTLTQIIQQRGINVAAPTLTMIRDGNYVEVTATCNDLGGLIYYHWYRDGVYLETTLHNTLGLYMQLSEQSRISVKCTNQKAPPPAPPGWPRFRTLFWTRCTDTDISYYLIQQNKDAGGWTDEQTVWDDPTQWSYTWQSARLVDLSSYQWRVVPYDLAGNAGTALTLDSIKIVGTPDAPDYTAAYNTTPDTVTFTEA